LSEVFVGVDVGTSSARAVAFDTTGRAHAAASRSYHLQHPDPHRAELDAEEVWEATATSLTETVAVAAESGHQVVALGLSTFMHSLMALDAWNRPLTGLLTWADARAAAQVEALRRAPEATGVYRRTGVPLHPMSPLAKLLWYRDEDSATHHRAARWSSIKDFLLLRLTGRWVLDVSVASTSGLLDLSSGRWVEDLLELTGVPASSLPPLVPATEIVAELDGPRAERFGLVPGTPVVAGAADGVLANVGVGALDPRVAVCSIGTSGAVRRTVDRALTDGEGRTFCYALDEDHWVIGGPINNGGVVLDWLLNKLFPDVAEEAERAGRDPHELVDEIAARSEPGAGGVVFLPYLLGERAPQWNPNARGLIFGLGISHGREDIVRAALEGVVLQLRSVERVLEDICRPATEIRATGGFAASELWCQIMADAFGTSVTVVADVEGTAWGAAVVAMSAVGAIDSLESAPRAQGTSTIYEPRPAENKLYDRLGDVFERLYAETEEELGSLESG
jgi:gluconokinase